MYILYVIYQCGHCKSLAPVYEELGDAFKGKDVIIGKVDADEHKSLGSKFGVTGSNLKEVFFI